jgi:alpha-galactosidase
MIWRLRNILGICALTLTVAEGAGAESPQPQSQLAETPPLGWNSFDSYLVYLPEKAAMKNIEAMAAKLKPHGYQYFVVDNGWFGEYRLRTGTSFPALKKSRCFCLGAQTTNSK